MNTNKMRYRYVLYALFLTLTSIQAQSVVTSTADSGPGSLRNAISDAPAGSTITFTNTLAGQTILSTSGQILIDKSLDIDASSIGGITIDGNGVVTSNRIFEVTSGAVCELNNLNLINGDVSLSISSGGAVLVNAGCQLTLNNSTIADNKGIFAGGLLSLGTVTLNNCTVMNNQAVTQDGGGLHNNTGTMALNNVTLTGNTAGDAAGGIMNYLGTMTLNHITLTGNSAVTSADGIYNNSVLNSTNSIVVDGGFGGMSGLNNFTAGDPMLAPLGDYGGSTHTMPPLAGSPVIDAGTNTVLSTDQHSLPRVVGIAADIGAVEFLSSFVLNTNDSGAGSLRQAFIDSSSGDTITFANLLSGQTIVLTNGQIAVTNNLNIDATSIGGITIDGNASSRIFHIATGGPILFNSLILTNGFTTENGGAVYAVFGADVALTNCTLSGNSADYGGGSFDCTLYNCTLTENSATTGGGGSYVGTLNNCSLLDNSSGNYGGGSYGGTLNNCILSGNTAAGIGGGSCQGTLTNCTLTGNSAVNFGGGSALGTLNNCMLTGNSANEGGGSRYDTLNNCTLTGNTATGPGGGSYGGTLNHCTLTNNSANEGGGSYLATLNSSALIGNSAAATGGGAREGTLNNCMLTGNSANEGGGSAFATLNNCTLTENSATNLGGGSFGGTLNNCIVYFNSAPSGPNYANTTFNYSCTTPLPAGTGNIAADPLLWNTSHIQLSSPCLGAGSTNYTSGVDIDGDAWAIPPAMGCDQPVGPFTGPLQITLSADLTNAVIGYALSFESTILGEVSSNRWDFGDGTFVGNSLAESHHWDVPGSYTVSMTAYNDDQPSGVSAILLVQVMASSNFYADVNSANPIPPYSSWLTAATNIQDAVDAAGSVAGATVLVADGVYNTGVRVTPGYAALNRVIITNNITVQSVNGPAFTYIVGEEATGGGTGSNAVRGVYMSTGHLSGFTITNGHTQATGDFKFDQSGGGVNLFAGSGTISNCSLLGNSASSGGGGSYYGTLSHCSLMGNSATGSGGGSYYGTLNNCTLSGNSATGSGGGSYQGTLNNCTLSGNLASVGGGSYQGTLNHCTLSGNSATGGGRGGNSFGGGSYSSTLTNCIVYFNSAPTNANYQFGSINYSCTTPLPAGTGNIDGDPQLAPLGDYGGQTQTMPPLSGSPAINAGLTSATNSLSDQRELTRVVGSAVDMGAVEIQDANDTASIAGSAWLTDVDSDGNAFGVEFALGTDWNTADGTNSANLAALSSGGASFGFNPAATNSTAWVLKRSLDLTSDPFVEIYRYDGPTDTTTTNIPVSVNMTASGIEVQDNSGVTNAYYQFEAEVSP